MAGGTDTIFDIQRQKRFATRGLPHAFWRAVRYNERMSDWQVLGPHHYQTEDDILYWRPQGEVLPQHAQGVCQLFDSIVERHGYVLWLVDAKRSVAVGFESRRVYARWIEQHKSGCLVIAAFGAPLPAQTTAGLILRGVQLVQGTQIDHEFCANEAVARVYLDTRRRTLRTAAAS